MQSPGPLPPDLRVPYIVRLLEDSKKNESKEMEEYQQQIQNLESEVREEYLESKRNKSRLSASHRQILQGSAPYEGTIFQYSNNHRSRKFKRELLGRYGTKSGVNPGIAWPTEKDLDLAAEWESLYQPIPLKQMMADTLAEEAEKVEVRRQREVKIQENLAKMESQLEAWRHRVSAKNRSAEGDRLRREKILSELKAEFGYDVNPEDEIMKNRIVEREKVLVKEERERKKAARAEKEKEMKMKS